MLVSFHRGALLFCLLSLYEMRDYFRGESMYVCEVICVDSGDSMVIVYESLTYTRTVCLANLTHWLTAG